MERSPRLSIWLAVLALVLGLSFGSIHAAVAQTISSVELSAATIDDADLPGFTSVAEPAAMVPNGFDAAFTRVLYATDLSGTIVFVNLSAAGSALPLPLLRQAATAGTVLKMITADPTKVANFNFTGPLNVGDADNSASWSGYDDATRSWLTFYGDVFVQGPILVTILYAGAPATVDSSVLGRAVAAQDAKLLNSQDLPAESGQ